MRYDYNTPIDNINIVEMLILYHHLLLCRPRATHKQIKINIPHSDKNVMNIKEEARKMIEDLMKDQNIPNKFKGQFVSSFDELRTSPGSKVVIFESTAHSLNKFLNEGPLAALSLIGYIEGVSAAFKGDSDALTKTSIVLSVIPVVGDILGVLENIRNEDYTDLAITASTLAVIATGSIIGGPVGIILDIFAGLIFLVKDFIQSEIDSFTMNIANSTKQYTGYRDEAWKKMILKDAREKIVPAMLKMYRMYEQSARESLEITIAMMKFKVKESLTSIVDPKEKDKLVNMLDEHTEDLYAAYNDHLIAIAARMIREMKSTLIQIVKDYYDKNFVKDSEKIVEAYRKDYVERYFNMRKRDIAPQYSPLDENKIYEEAASNFDEIKEIVIKTPLSLEDNSWLEECFNEVLWPDLINYFHMPIVLKEAKFINTRSWRERELEASWEVQSTLPTELQKQLRVGIQFTVSYGAKINSSYPSLDGYYPGIADVRKNVAFTDGRIRIPDPTRWEGLEEFDANWYFTINLPEEDKLIDKISSKVTYHYLYRFGQSDIRDIEIKDNGIPFSESKLFLPKRYKEYLINFNSSGLPLIYKWFNEPFGWPVRQAGYDGSSSFRWKFTPIENGLYKIVITEDKEMHGIANWGQYPILSPYEDRDEFKWKLEYLGSGKFALVSVYEGGNGKQYLGIVKSEVEDIYAEETFDFQMVSKSDDNLFEWELIEASPNDFDQMPISGVYHTIYSNENNRKIYVPSGEKLLKQGDVLTADLTFFKDSESLWRFERYGDSFYTIHHAQTGKILTDTKGKDYEAFISLENRKGEIREEQLWKFKYDAPKKGYVIMSKSSNKVIEARKGNGKGKELILDNWWTDNNPDLSIHAWTILYT